MTTDPTLYPFDPTAAPREWLPPELDPDRERRHLRCKNGIYRFYGTERELLYIGTTTFVWGTPERWLGHRASAKWWHLAAYLSVVYLKPGVDRFEAERKAIRSERPAFNVVHNRQRVQLEVRLDEGPDAIVAAFRRHLFAEDFAALRAAFAGASDDDMDAEPEVEVEAKVERPDIAWLTFLQQARRRP